jgi:hypothetical protein
MITILINDLKNVHLFNAGLGEASGVGQLVTQDEKGVALGELSYLLKDVASEPREVTTVR